MISEDLETIDEKTAKSLFQHIASSIGFDACKIEAMTLPHNRSLVMYEICLTQARTGTIIYLFKEDSRTGSLENLYIMASLFKPPTFKMFLSNILQCSTEGWHIKFINCGKKTLLPAFSTIESLFVLEDLNDVSV